ncbi:MAG TPA: quinol:cytochrome C oxidoreductase, partial [Planctomycetota bacterium]|nr:quinol:cytochrome C oxidoreductase [Planctomycetota bacterium]
MSSHSSHGAVDLGAVQAPGFEAGRKLSLVAAVVGLAGALGLAAVQEGGWRHLQFAWLFGTMFFVTLGFGGLFFVLLQYITRAGWSVVVRRIAEHVMSTLPMVTLLLLPLVILAMMGNGDLFTWANLDKIRDHHPEELHLYEHKAAYLNGTFFLIRFAIYVAIWMAMARYFKSGSLAQDQDGDPVRTLRMQRVAAPCTLLFALSITFAAVDFMMSLDAPWFSTIFGVYVFAGSFLAFMSFLGLMTQR